MVTWLPGVPDAEQSSTAGQSNSHFSCFLLGEYRVRFRFSTGIGLGLVQGLGLGLVQG